MYKMLTKFCHLHSTFYVLLYVLRHYMLHLETNLYLKIGDVWLKLINQF